MFKVLAIDGGGIRGVIPGMILKYLEEQKEKSISEMFDLIVGTSTGGILAAGLTRRGVGKQPKFTANDMLELYTDYGKDIFNRSFWDGVTSLGGLTDEKYSERPLEKLLKQYLGNATLKDCLTPVVITSYDIERRKPYFFKTRRANESDDRNHYLRDAARATSAAPTYFEPEPVKSLAKPTPTRRVLVDGGVFVNNPALVAYIEAVTTPGCKPDDMMVLSLGTGTATRPIPYEKARDWGVAGWARPVLSVMMDGQADSADYHLEMLLPGKNADQRYFRLDTELKIALDDMDAANAANIMALKAEAELILEKQAAEIQTLLSLL